jgi:serine/threonine protein kinase
MNALLPDWLDELIPPGERLSLGRRCILVRGEHQSYRVKYGDTVEDAHVLQREALWLHRLRHLNIPLHQGLSLNKYADKTVLITSFIEGESGSEWFRRHHQAQDEEESAVKYLPSLFANLNQLHQFGVVHGDIKLSNILFLKGERACLIDFSNTRRIGESWNERGMIQLTPGYRYPTKSPVARCEHDYFALLLCIAMLLHPKELTQCTTIGSLLQMIDRESSVWEFSDDMMQQLEFWITSIRNDLGNELDISVCWNDGVSQSGTNAVEK